MKNFLFILLWVITFTTFAQSGKKNIAKGNEFLKLIRVREVLDTILWKEEAKIFNNTDRIFKENGLDPKNGPDYEFFQFNVMQQFLFSKRHILKQLRYQYQHFPYEELKKYIREIKKGKRNKVIYSSGLHTTIKRLVKRELDGIHEEIIPKYIDFILKKYKPVDLSITYNGKQKKAADLDLKVLVVTNNTDYRVVNILDKENNQLLKPQGYTYEQIQEIIIIFQGEEYIFKPNEKIFRLPRRLTEVKNFTSQYSFEEISKWKIDINETSHNTSIKLTNVVEAHIVKTKVFQKKLNQKIIK